MSILELSNLICQKVGYLGEINWDSSKPDGMLRKCMDVTNMKREGFQPNIDLSEGINQVINSYNNIKI